MTDILGKRSASEAGLGPAGPVGQVEQAEPTHKRDNCIDLCDDMIDIIISMPLFTAGDRCQVFQLVNRHWMTCYRRDFRYRYGVDYTVFLTTYQKALAVGLKEATDIPAGVPKAPWALLGAIRLKDSSPFLYDVLDKTVHPRAWSWPTLYHYRNGAFVLPRSDRLLPVACMRNIDMLMLFAFESGDDELVRRCLEVGTLRLSVFMGIACEYGTLNQLVAGISAIMSNGGGAPESGHGGIASLLEHPEEVYATASRVPRNKRRVVYMTMVDTYLGRHNGRCSDVIFCNVPDISVADACMLVPDDELFRLAAAGRRTNPTIAILSAEMARRGIV
jgi:hypothetical protein